METPQSSPRLLASDNIFLRWCLVAGLALATVVPLQIVQSLVRERSHRYDEVLTDIASVWGSQQILQGPLLVVPYLEAVSPLPAVPAVVDPDAPPPPPIPTNQRHAVLLPETLDVDVSLRTENLHRGIHDALVFAADITLSGQFGELDLPALSDRLVDVQWDRAYLVVGLSDPSALSEVRDVRWGSGAAEFDPGAQLGSLIQAGFHAPVILDKDAASTAFSAELLVKGSGGFRFAPFGKRTTVDVASSWPHPSFQGSPTTSRIDDAGFAAQWKVSHLNRSYPQQFVLHRDAHNLSADLAGVDLYEPVTLYDKVGRATKYGLLFVCLTFLVFVLFEMTGRSRLHLVQYALVGVALSLFYLTLLALSEHVAFGVAYSAASLVAICMIALFSWGALRSGRRAGLIGGVLSLLYGVLYVILHMEDYALLGGTLVLLLATAASMYMTRELNAGPE